MNPETAYTIANTICNINPRLGGALAKLVEARTGQNPDYPQVQISRTLDLNTALRMLTITTIGIPLAVVDFSCFIEHLRSVGKK